MSYLKVSLHPAMYFLSFVSPLTSQAHHSSLPLHPPVLTRSDGLQGDVHIAQGDVCGSGRAALEGRVAGGQRAEQRAARGRAQALGLGVGQSRRTGHCTVKKGG